MIAVTRHVAATTMTRWHRFPVPQRHGDVGQLATMPMQHDDDEAMQASDDNDNVTAMESIHDVTNYLRLALVDYSVVMIAIQN